MSIANLLQNGLQICVELSSLTNVVNQQLELCVAPVGHKSVSMLL
jgi:hypothetical protein